MVSEPDDLVWSVVGVLGALALGVVLIPFRSVTPAANLALAFVPLTIAVAEAGGRRAGLATAVVAALSLNFFLTGPYLTLAIDRSDDVVAFVGLAASGLVASAFGRRRLASRARAGRGRRALAALAGMARPLAEGRPPAETLEALREALELGAVVLRASGDRLVAAAPAEAAGWPLPTAMMDPRTLLGAGGGPQRVGRRGLRLPATAARLRLPGRQLLTLDLWEGSPEGWGPESTDALDVAASLLALAASGPGRPGPPGSS